MTRPAAASLVLLASLALSAAGAPAGEAGAAPAPLPASLLEVLGAELPGLSPAGAHNFDEELLERLSPAPANLEELARARGDFDGDGNADWVLLLTGSQEHLVAIVFDRGSDAWLVHPLARWKGPLPARGRRYVRALTAEDLATREASRDGEGRSRPRPLTDIVEIGSGGMSTVTFFVDGRPITLPPVRSDG
jgi:hypothetical protein